MLSGLLRIFTWWQGQTLNTQFYTWRRGKPVGSDTAGNRYFQTADGKRRWVIFAGESEASQVPPDWHGWLHHTFEQPPTKAPLAHKAWEAPHVANLTGTAQAWHPPGSISQTADKAPAQGYVAWAPDASGN